MANIPVPDVSGTQNYSGYGTDQAWWSMPVTVAAPAPAPNLAVIADGYLTPGMLPGQMVAAGPDGATYLDLWSTFTPEGIPAVGWMPGTYAYTAGAMPRI